MKKRCLALFLSMLLLFGGCTLPPFDNSSSSFEDSSSSSEDSSMNSSEDSSIDSSSSSSSNDHGDGDNDCAHTDTNKDDICDSCEVSVAVTFDFFAINDIHGKFADSDTQPGVDELTTYLKQARNENENTVLLSSGDTWQGAPESNLTKGAILTEWMNEMEFSSMTLGNHEYDWGEEYIERNAELAEFPFLALNIYERATDLPVSYTQPSVIVEKSNVKIGIIGAIGDCYSSISADKSGDIYFKTGSQLTALVKAESEKLRAEGADFIIYSIHDDKGGCDNALTNGYVDLVFEGHSHQSYVQQDINGVYHLQGGGDNDGITHAEVKINYVNDTSTVNTAEFIATSRYEHLEGDPIVETLLKKYEEEISIAGKVLGQNDRFRSSDEILSTCATLYCEAGLERWGKEYDIVLGGGFMSARSPYEIPAGTVIYGDLQNILPFDNQLVLCSISGAKLKSQFIETSNSRYYVALSEYGNSIRNSIQNNGTYYIVTDTYSSTYASNGCTEIERYDETTFSRDLLAKYIEEGNWTVSLEDMQLTSIPKIHEIGNALADNAESSQKYYVQGKIININGTKYGNMTIVDEDGNELYIYGLYDANGNRYEFFTNPPVVGDTILVYAPIKKYVYNGTTTIELFYADYVKTVQKGS